jgi:hypothetical protein
MIDSGMKQWENGLREGGRKGGEWTKRRREKGIENESEMTQVPPKKEVKLLLLLLPRLTIFMHWPRIADSRSIRSRNCHVARNQRCAKMAA